MKNCNLCPRGFYQEKEGQGACKPCEPGTAQALAGKEQCDICPPGKYSNVKKAVTCELCGRGYYQPNIGANECESCLWGKITKGYASTDESQCFWEACPPGFRYVGGEEMCVKCMPGSFSTVINAPECTECELGWYNEFERASFCYACPKTHFTYTKGSSKKSDCQGPILIGYTMENFHGKTIEITDTTASFGEEIASVRAFRGSWDVYSYKDNKGYHVYLTEGHSEARLKDVLSHNNGLSAATNVNDVFCYTEKGQHYKGNRDYTESGKSCQMWASTFPHKHTHTKQTKNFCRNPDSAERPWCYTNDADTRWEYCDVPSCVWNNACMVGDGEQYRGKVHTTLGGSNCQNWDSDWPHPHGYHSDSYANYGIGNHNYCRNPDGQYRAWCYTMHLFVRWDYCRIPYCNIEDYPYYKQ
jgi:hypothetical protein